MESPTWSWRNVRAEGRLTPCLTLRVDIWAVCIWYGFMLPCKNIYICRDLLKHVKRGV